MQDDLPYRSHERLQNYWNQLRKERPFPQESEIDPDEIADIWPSCFLISIDDVTHRLGHRYSYLGDELVKACGDDISNPDNALRLLSMGSIPMMRKIDDVLKQKKLVIDASDFINLKQLHIRYRTCMLPLGHKNGEVSHILGCIHWQVC